MGRGDGEQDNGVQVQRRPLRRYDQPPTLVIADVHGHYDRLVKLLSQEGVIDPQTEQRTNFDVRVIQLGDLGHFGDSGTPTGDYLCYKMANEWFDAVCWGNHDRAVFSNRHAFSGYQRPADQTIEQMLTLSKSGKVQMAHSAHGYLLTHAGVHTNILQQLDERPEHLEEDLEQIVERLNDVDNKDAWDAIGYRRGGGSEMGGLLWRDADEALDERLPQIFGHSSDQQVRSYPTMYEQDSLCLDIGNADNDQLAAVWLPERRVVTIG